ncbi:pirin-like [Apostichopus japonicus]|uniref:pirin-like n=1 Tax=Stichopus japonicus TaxID=307972 RepID=UPI003AB31C40
MSCHVMKTIPAEEEEEGLGIRVKRTIGGSKMDYLDPFLQLDHFQAQKPSCMPDHPSRGFQTVTYMLQGSIKYSDFCGNVGTVTPGDVQVVSSGCGMVYSESPVSDDEAVGIQLYVNISEKDKLSLPGYQYTSVQDIPEVVIQDGIKVSVVLGEAFSSKCTSNCITPVNICDVTIATDRHLEIPVQPDWSVLIYILSGKLIIGPPSNTRVVLSQEAAVISKGDDLHIENKGTDPCRFLLMTGKCLGEEISRQGSFVMNTEEDIRQTIKDYHLRKNGFERATDWSSTTGLEYLDSQF